MTVLGDQAILHRIRARAALGAATRRAIHASVTGTLQMQQQITIAAERGPIVAKNDF
jgi:hypothetical protein